MARPATVIKWDDVEKLCGLQCTQEEIAQFCGVTVDTLNARCKADHEMSFSEFFDAKRGLGKVSLSRAQWQLAIKGNPTLLIWLGKQYLGQRDKTSAELSGPDGKPVEVSNASALTDAQLEARYLTLLEKAKSNGG